MYSACRWQPPPASSSLKRRQEPRKPSNTGQQSHATNQVRRILRMFSTVVSRFSTRPSCSAFRVSTKPSRSARFPIADDFSRARLRFSTRRRQWPIASHPRKPLRSYAHPPGLRYPHATHCIFQFPSIILLVPYVYAALQLR